MYVEYSPEVEAERERRKQLGLPTLRWYRCHGCEAEYEYCARIGRCDRCGSRLNIHSDLDGEQPLYLAVSV